MWVAAKLVPLAVLLLALTATVQAQFNYETVDGRITITGYTGSGGEVIIPDTIEGLPVTGIRDWAFSFEYVTDLTDPAESDWRCLEYLQLPTSPHLWADKSALATGKRFYRAVAMDAPANMVFIPPGAFRMGSPEDEVGRWEAEGLQTPVGILEVGVIRLESGLPGPGN